LLTRLDGNALFLSGYNRHARISGNEFAHTGDNAIAAWGYTSGSDPNQPVGTGFNGTAGDFPRYTVVESNFIHHLGIHEKQSSCWFQAQTAQTTLRNNICFEIPRAGFNFNDGFGGGNNVYQNLLFNTCMESGDHGSINSWDRQPYLTTVATGQPSLIPAVNVLHHNFLVSNFDADGGAIDNDDGSSYYDEYANFGVYGGFKAGNFEGHSKKHHGNINAYARVYDHACFWNWPGSFPLKPYQEQYYNNTCILDNNQHYITMTDRCKFTELSSVGIVTHDNRIYVDGNTTVKGCGSQISFDAWLRLGLDVGSSKFGGIASSEIMKMAANMLGF
jgi:hypothetical protein